MKKISEKSKERIAMLQTVVLGFLFAFLLIGIPTAYSAYKNSHIGDDATSTSNGTKSTDNPTSSPNQPANNKASSPTNNGKKRTFNPGGCTKTTIPFQTEYVNNSGMYVGETKEALKGVDGWISKCTAASWSDETPQKINDITNPPMNRVIYVGTKTPTTTPPSGYTYAEALNRSESNCRAVGANGSAWQQCVNAYMHQYGY